MTEPKQGSAGNLDRDVIDAFGDEWSAFDQRALSGPEWKEAAKGYFHLFPFDKLPPDSIGFDLGCGSGRWARYVAPRVGTLHCIDPASSALDVAKKSLGDFPNVTFSCASADDIPLADSSQDFGYSLGVLHHIPDTLGALKRCTAKLKPGAPFLVYLYYALENRPLWFRALWRTTDLVRKGICRLPFPLRKATTDVIAASVYWPVSRIALLVEKLGGDPAGIPLTYYRNRRFYTLRTDALDRFGTRLEHRFTRSQIKVMMEEAGLRDIVFSDRQPFWVALGYKA